MYIIYIQYLSYKVLLYFAISSSYVHGIMSISDAGQSLLYSGLLSIRIALVVCSGSSSAVLFCIARIVN